MPPDADSPCFPVYQKCGVMHATPKTLPARSIEALRAQHGAGLSLAHLIDAGGDDLPMPGEGRTFERWQILAAVAACDLSLAKLYEGHTDAFAILHELRGDPAPQGSSWGTWCAEPPDARLEFTGGDGEGEIRVHGTKAWCSGAAEVTHALVSGWNADGLPCLAAVCLDQPGVEITRQGWEAVGMAGSASVDVRFSNARARMVGTPGAYTARPGFWHGGIGVAACWYGGGAEIARMAAHTLRSTTDPHRLAHLGAIEVALAGAAAVLREAAAAIDAKPLQNAHALALRARLAVEACCETVLHHATRAVGAGPLCRDGRFARFAADLPVYVRQSHAERDLAALGKARMAQASEVSWTL